MEVCLFFERPPVVVHRIFGISATESVGKKTKPDVFGLDSNILSPFKNGYRSVMK